MSQYKRSYPFVTSQVQGNCENTYFSVIFTKMARKKKVAMFQLIQKWVWCSGWPLSLTNGPQKHNFEVSVPHRPLIWCRPVRKKNLSKYGLDTCPLIFELLIFCRLTLWNSLIGQNVFFLLKKMWSFSRVVSEKHWLPFILGRSENMKVKNSLSYHRYNYFVMLWVALYR